jgi:hypothetical protein
VTVFVSIGNSDDRLAQAVWHRFFTEVSEIVNERSSQVHGEWLSVPHAPWQNACWAFDPLPGQRDRIRELLALLADEYHQDSIAWMEADTEFITPRKMTT